MFFCRYLLLSQCWDESPEIRPCFLIIVQSLKTIISNWEGHDNTLKKQMEVEMQMSLDQDGYESDSQELEGSGSMAAKIGSRARYPPRTDKKHHSQRCSSSSSVGMSTINSTTALVGGRVTRNSDTNSPQTVSTTRPAGFDLSNSLSDDEYIAQCRASGHDYYNFSPVNGCDCCCNGSTNSLECKHASNNSGNSDEQALTPPQNVPMFEMFYDTGSNRQSTSSLLKSSTVVPSKPNQLQFRDRDLEVSQSSCGTETTNLPDTPMDPSFYKSVEVEPADYSLPVRITPQPPQTLPNGLHGGLAMSSRGSSKSSHNPSVSSSCIPDRTVSISSPTNHFYFTLDPACNTPSVFDSDTSNSQNSCDTPKTSNIHKTSCSSEIDNPVLAYHTSKYADLQTEPRPHTTFYPSVLPTESMFEEEVIHGSAPHRHLVLEHSGRKFDSELTP